MSKKIIFTIVPDSQDNPVDIFFNTNKNSLLEYNQTTQKFLFKSKITGAKEIFVEVLHLSFDEELYTYLNGLVEISLHKASEISKEPIGRLKPGESYNGVFSSTIQKASYNNPESIFHFVADVFIKMLMGHKLTNGNKRTALIFMIILLRHFGYHFVWSAGLQQNYYAHTTKVENLVLYLQNTDTNITECDKLNYVANWIKAQCVIALEWR